MPEQNRNDWTPFRIVKPSENNGSNTQCLPLTEISHVTHNSTAVEILDRGLLSAGLVYDDSVLTTQRILVNWLSPNDWKFVGGSRYGNASFDFKWADIVRGMNAYWVGSMNYSPVAARILLSHRDHSGSLLRYDPTTGDGPWWHDVKSNQHYWNSTYCLEVMLERDLKLDEVAEIRGVDHHDIRCNVRPGGTCPDAGSYSLNGVARLVALLVSRGIQPARHQLFKSESGEPTRLLCSASKLQLACKDHDSPFAGMLQTNHASAMAVARAVLAAYARRDDNERSALAKFFANVDEARAACRTLVEEHFHLTIGSLTGPWC